MDLCPYRLFVCLAWGFDDYTINSEINFTSIHKQIPQSVGSSAAITVHLTLPVSFLIVISVVAQGQWKSEKSRTQSAVVIVHPLAIKSSLN